MAATLGKLHREDVKARLRKRHGSIARFERESGLPKSSVSDVLRGRPSARVEQAIIDALAISVSPQRESEISVDTATNRGAHRLNAGAR